LNISFLKSLVNYNLDPVANHDNIKRKIFAIGF
jgi:hypothetical protein